MQSLVVGGLSICPRLSSGPQDTQYECVGPKIQAFLSKNFPNCGCKVEIMVVLRRYGVGCFEGIPCSEEVNAVQIPSESSQTILSE